LSNFGGDLAPHGNHVRNGDVHGIAPKRTVVGDVHGFQSDLDLVAFFQVVPSADVGRMHSLAGFLQVEGGRVVFAGGSERADRKRANVTERRCNLVGQSKAQKIHILIRAQVLQRKNGDGSLTGGDHSGCGALLDKPKQNSHHDRNRGKCSGDLRIVPVLRRSRRRFVDRRSGR